MTSTTPVASSADRARKKSVAAWALRQTIVGFLILGVTIGGTAWLLHASIDPAVETPVAGAPERSG